ncbi:hypothetical protein [Brevibacillus choshinensis]|uniref:hypothetical protein n=1 Tax=Brevibacillus choshinensis TaxID=54911 RepID=UPI002E20558D|nr:hypothetical protein [Brevibacillus choshinensis]
MINWCWEDVDLLESQGKWNEAKETLIKHWNMNRTDLKILIRLGFFCWYVLVEEGPLGITGVDFDELENVLHEVTIFGLDNFAYNEDFLWSFGYMISLFPYHFGDYEHWEAKGNQMLKQVNDMYPDDPIYKYSYLGSLPGSYGQHKSVFLELQAIIDERFQGEGVLSGYFKSVWHQWHGI